MAEMYPAPPDILERIERLANAYHPHLRAARLKVEVREKSPTILKALTWAEVKTPANDAEAKQFDFALWFALDAWADLNDTQRDALVEHELYHCVWDDEGKPQLYGHEIEEYNGVLERYGLWWPDAKISQDALIRMAQTGREDSTMPEFISEHLLGPFGGGNHGSTGAGNHGSTGAGNHGSTGAGNHGSTGAGNHGSTGAFGDEPEDALIIKLKMLRAKLREQGFSEIETGRLSDTFLRHWTQAVMEGNHGSSGA